jgi:beta-glucosidase
MRGMTRTTQDSTRNSPRSTPSRHRRRDLEAAAASTLAMSLAFAATAHAAPDAQPWLDRSKPPEERAQALVGAMTQDEKLRIIFGFGAVTHDFDKTPDDVAPPELRELVKARSIRDAAGFVQGVPRLGIPDQLQTDASMGVRTKALPSTALPSSLATAASFDPEVPRAGGAMIGSEARAYGFNELLAGGVNLAREPRNGRNFEYTGEDPLLAGTMAGALVRGIQSTHMISTVKHFAVNDQETLRNTVDATISAEAMRQSDLLAFEIAYEHGRPASVMCSYNLVNGRWACENDYLLNKVLKQDWGFKGFVMSDWGAVHSTADAANDGLDEFTGYAGPYSMKPYFAPGPFKAAMAGGLISEKRLDDMAGRILWSLFSTGAMDDPPKPAKIDYAADAAISQKAAEDSLVLLKNAGGLLPLKGVRSLAVIGGHADKGVPSGGGSSAVTPYGGSPYASIYMPSSPVEALKQELPGAQVSYDEGDDTARAAALAARSDVAVVFVTQFMSEGLDGQLQLKGNQDALVEAVGKANPKTVVVVESGGAILMPWAERTPAILEAFYPGIRGGAAIARILTGKVNPSGHLPISFPASPDQLAHAEIAGAGKRIMTPAAVTYDEGAAIGYKWYDLKGYKPLFAFGHGLSYTTFAVSDLKPHLDGATLKVAFTIRNTGPRAGKGVAQVYVSPSDARAAGWEAPKRLAAFAKADLKPGQAKAFDLAVDPRLLATYDAAGDNWSVSSGTYRILLGQASDDLPAAATVDLPAIRWSAAHAAR